MARSFARAAWTEKDKEISDQQVIEGKIRGKCKVFVSCASGPYNSKGLPDSNVPGAIWYLAMDAKVEQE